MWDLDSREGYLITHALYPTGEEFSVRVYFSFLFLFLFNQFVSKQYY